MAHEIERLAGITAGGSLAEALNLRADVLARTDRSREAALAPKAPGGLSHGLRAALASRISALHGDTSLADHYRARMKDTSSDPLEALCADPSFDGANDTWLAALLRHVDLITTAPRDAVAEDIERLGAADVSEADIVRLSQLIAFLAYELRLVAGLRLLGTGR